VHCSVVVRVVCSFMATYHKLTHSTNTGFSLPDKFKPWGEATKAVMEARAANKTPEKVDPEIWKIFEMMAFNLIPAISG
jgi:hypothetical protein